MEVLMNVSFDVVLLSQSPPDADALVTYSGL